MKIVQMLLTMLEDASFTDGDKAEIMDSIESAAVGITLNPRDKTESNGNILCAALRVILKMVEDLYGKCDGTKIYLTPIFIDQSASQIAPLQYIIGTVGLGIGQSAKSWEEVFYDLCHETVHLLNPVMGVKNKRVSALEEGCAVKFAEQTYEKYIKPYCNKVPRTSPISYPSCQYFSAYSAAKKIPDSVLKDIRREFGSFSNINDAEKLKNMAGDYVDDKDIEVLVKSFLYK